MADVFSKSKRSEVMSHIRSRGNQDTEVALAKLFRRHKITGWRRQVTLAVRSSRREEAHSSIRKSVGASSPRLLWVRVDFVFPKSRTAVFVDGCFWHGCPKHGTHPKGNRAFWKNKFARNIARDLLVTRTLRSANWWVLRIWEHTLRRATMKPQNEARLLRRIQRALL
ncbi:MAG: very short patch repair endonuclease [Verrucomicrobiales bacterium]|nr:very short patch repair endonuclease [Verrucomicrobiales bacterium]